MLQTAVAVGVEPDNKLPYNEYYEYFGPDYTLHVEPHPMENQNSPRDLEKIRFLFIHQTSHILVIYASDFSSPYFLDGGSGLLERGVTK